MSNFEVFVHDDRYSLPVRRMTVVTDERQIRTIAERVLAESAHHLGVEVLEYGTRVFGIGLAADPGRAQPSWNAKSRKMSADPRTA